ESQAFIGKVCLLPIGIHPQFCKETHSHYFLTDKEYLCSIYQPRPPFSHKDSYGHAAIAGGSYGMMGAIALASKACLRSGVGKITALIPEAGYTMFQTLVPEAMCLTQSEKYISSFEQFCNNKNYSIVAIGPGLGLMDVTIKAFIQFIETHKSNLVLDADALNMLSQHKELLHQLHPNTILTPHHKEFERLFGTSTNTLQRVETARSMAMLHNVIIVLKGHHTTILTPEGECWYNSTGNAGMATAGSGDVLTGIILALIAQNYEPKEAAIMGVYLHGLAGDKAVEKLGMESLTASDLIQYLPEAFKSLQNSH
ncbi:MAG TPA: NAD(P)H-hydrate dehydratase, partial [Flavipsychrobacter sp.]|nr:NAD(P)H-hydrate dehydratase [Flavipsychrobacter sp.]